MSTTIFEYECPVCATVVDISVLWGRPAQIGGPPERCYPEDPTEHEPEHCPRCNFCFDRNSVIEEAGEAWWDARDAAADYRNEKG